MRTSSHTVNVTDNKMGWIELVLFLSDNRYLDKQRLSEWENHFARMTIAGMGPRPEDLPARVGWHSYHPEEARSTVWNRLLAESRKEWTLFVEDDEQLRLDDFPRKKSLSPNCWLTTLIRYRNGGAPRHFYQIRLVHSGTGDLFDGRGLPDCTQYIRQQNISLLERPVIFERQSDPVAHVDTDEELSVRSASPQLYLVQGERYFKQGKYVHAAAQYRQLLKAEKLLPFDRLGAVNGLASCLTEQFKWSKALALAQKSVEAEPAQRVPYLIQFKIFELQKQWEKAYQALLSYYEKSDRNSRANFDRMLQQEEALLNLANVALKAGRRKEASDFFEKLFTVKQGKVERSFLHRVLLLSIELFEYERSVSFFERMFGDRLPDKLDQAEQEELDDFMSMFMQKGWYEYVAEVYRTLYHHYPENREYKRRLIVSLTKINKVERARELITDAV
ncbi:hypothetical protein NC796_26105 [Aliifodinibius sp. S!AR15-10]|uniref:tetratricopeptide repeat protein n=1 Tax=Aliifodinibius sp. S!AR15-10 TaxID=2950437 RepID=UPI0028553FBA|nr:hypothetical protein [Aliifodinibius sp. S!AR15-10]MDR8394645.1 hypothetical protein [Aliifodinibius sp. S!AR15-10]